MTGSDQQFECVVTRTARFEYLLYRPDRDNETAYPLVLFLHGAGEKGTDLGLVRRRAVLPRLLEDGLQVPAFVACPKCPPERAGWPIDDLAMLLDALLERLPVDRRRVYVTGVSMGGRGTWEWSYEHSARVAAIAPVCGIGIPTLAPRLAGLPVWVFHGENDEIVPVQRSDEMVAALRAAGNECRYSRLAGAFHNCGEAVYGDPALWRWMFEQRRT